MNDIVTKLNKVAICLFALISTFCSCVDEVAVPYGEDISIVVKADIGLRNGTGLDNTVSSFRVLAFDSADNIIVLNQSFQSITQDPGDDSFNVAFKLKAGTYNFVFVANEPQSLAGIIAFEQLSAMAFPASAFNSTGVIPMIVAIDNVNISAGNVTINNENKGGSENNPWLVGLDRMGVSLEFTFKSERDLSDSFLGLSLSQLPDKVPLFPDTYTGSAIIWNETRSYENTSYFEDAGITENGMVWSQKSKKRIIIPANPFGDLEKEDDSKAVKFTVDLGSDKKRSAFLNPQDPEDLGYSLPQNIGLSVMGHISESLVLSIEASEWSELGTNWQAQNHYLNVSDVSVKITDYNGARITFSSNMPKVYVMEEAMQDGSPVNTENIFNDLVLIKADTTKNGDITTYSTSRFKYAYNTTTQTGSGYMDILLDEFKIEGDDTTGSELHNNFTITLCGEDPYNGGIQREIKVTTSQHGLRFNYNNSGQGYVGAFFRHNEIGERVITGQLSRMPDGSLREWRAWVEPADEGKELIVLSTSPSFDPTIGTDNPGNPENYIVIPNEFKKEDGSSSYWEKEKGTFINKGRGRIYFRIGLNKKLDNEDVYPVYAKIFIVVLKDNGEYDYNMTYIRQGEAPDYLYENGDNISEGDLQGATRTHSRKISPYNLTAADVYTGNGDQVFVEDKGIFVDYPTQAGAFFQWSFPDGDDANKRIAYHPTSNPGGIPGWYEKLTFLLNETDHLGFVWDDATDSSIPSENPPYLNNITYEYGHGEKSDLCPGGYHRPSDGYTDRVATNGVYPNYFDGSGVRSLIQPVYGTKDPVEYTIIQKDPVDRSSEIAYSEFRQSLYKIPRGGDGSPDEEIWSYNLVGKRIPNFWLRSKYAVGDYLQEWEAKRYIPGSYGLYADGFFDRRPIKNIRLDGNKYPFSVSSENGQVAYRGYLIVNEATSASIFFPAAGRRASNDGRTNDAWCGSSGYYYSSSSGPVGNANTPQSVWSMDFNTYPGWCYPIYHLPTFGQSVRCVKDEE